jgi:hypothetical protein
MGFSSRREQKGVLVSFGNNLKDSLHIRPIAKRKFPYISPSSSKVHK